MYHIANAIDTSLYDCFKSILKTIRFDSYQLNFEKTLRYLIAKYIFFLGVHAVINIEHCKYVLV